MDRSNTTKQKIGIGYIDLKDFLKENLYFIDKTSFIEHFLEQKDVVTLITRPRRFGKTLSMNILEHFFSISSSPTEQKNLFHDLQISQNLHICQNYMGKYPVISLSFGRIEGESFASVEELLKSIFIELYDQFSFIAIDLERLKRNYQTLNTKSNSLKQDLDSVLNTVKTQNLNILSDKDESPFNFSLQQVKEDFKRFRVYETDLNLYRNALRNLIRYVAIYYMKPVILLIDEYDVPLTKALTNGYYDQMLSFMKPVIGVIKDNKYLFKAVLTGCLRVAQESLFTGANNFEHYGIDQITYSTDFGFTKEETLELLKYYHLEKCIDELVEWYDGYLFGKTNMICPWNIINFCKHKLADPNIKPSPYWINSSENAILNVLLNNLNPQLAETLQQLTDQQSTIVSINDHQVLNFFKNYSVKADLVSLNEAPIYSEQAFWTILYNAGYITRSPLSYNYDLKHDQRLVKIPNREILETFKEQIIDRFSVNNKIHNQNSFELLHLFSNVPSEQNSYKIMDEIHDLLEKFISIRDGAKGSFKDHPEWYYHAFLNGLFSAIFSLPEYSDHFYASNRELGNGYADISFKIPSAINSHERIGVIIEIKAIDDLDKIHDPDIILDKALAQIENKKYVQGMMNKFAYYSIKTIYQYAILFCKKDCLVKAKKIEKSQLQ